MKTVLLNAKRVVKDNQCETVNVLIEAGEIRAIGQENYPGDVTIDCKGNLLLPGLVDVHVHFREPGFTEKETIASGTMAAARGGFTTVCAMPNTNPIPDTKEKYQDILNLIERDAKVKVLHYAPITEGLRSDVIVDMDGINAFAYTNDGVGVQTAGIMYEAMKVAQAINKSIVAHTEDETILYGGVMHQGKVSARLGFPGIIGAVESSQIARDVILAKETGVHYHICHVSSSDSVAAIKMGKAIGANVTAEVTPHHLLLCDEDILDNDGNYKMNPPLRSKEDQEALISGLLDGTIAMIATDHAPHTDEEKGQGFAGPFGIIGLEIAFPTLYTRFVKDQKRFTLQQLQQWMSYNPQDIFGIKGNKMKVGDPADFALFDLENTFEINQSILGSKSRNTPFMKENVNGRCVLTMVNGECVWKDI